MPPTALASLAVAAITVGYTLKCWMRPFAPCRRCGGTGNRAPRHLLATAAPTRRKRQIRKPCKHCKGTGARLRVARRIHNHARRLHREGTR